MQRSNGIQLSLVCTTTTLPRGSSRAAAIRGGWLWRHLLHLLQQHRLRLCQLRLSLLRALKLAQLLLQPLKIHLQVSPQGTAAWQPQLRHELPYVMMVLSSAQPRIHTLSQKL